MVSTEFLKGKSDKKTIAQTKAQNTLDITSISMQAQYFYLFMILLLSLNSTKTYITQFNKLLPKKISTNNTILWVSLRKPGKKKNWQIKMVKPSLRE